eukprot:3008332-Rhodomonas_salina.2
MGGWRGVIGGCGMGGGGSTTLGKKHILAAGPLGPRAFARGQHLGAGGRVVCGDAEGEARGAVARSQEEVCAPHTPQPREKWGLAATRQNRHGLHACAVRRPGTTRAASATQRADPQTLRPSDPQGVRSSE